MSGSNSKGYSFRISAEGMQEFAQDLGRLSGQSDQAHAAITRLIQASPDLASSLLKAEDATKRAADRARDLQEAQTRAAQAAAALPAANIRMADSLDRLESRTLAARRGVADFRGALELLGATGASQSLGPVTSYIGNVADLFGTASLAAGRFDDVVAALTPRLATIAGMVALPAFLQSVGLGINSAGEAADDAGTAMDRWRGVLERLNPTLEQTAQRAKAAAEEIRITNLRVAEIEFGRAMNTRGTLIGQASDIDRRIAEAEGQLGTISGRIANNRSNPPLLGAREEGRQLQAQLEVAERRLLELRERRAAVAREFEGMQVIGREFEQLRDRYSAPIYSEPAGPPAPPPTGRPAAPPRVAPVRPAQDADAHVRAFQAAQQAEERRREQKLRDFEKQSLDAFARIGENAMDRIGGSLVDAFVRGEGAAVNFGNILRGVIASAATDLIKLGLINPFVNSAFGLSRPTLGGAASAMGGGGMGGGGDLLSGLGSLSGMGSLLGLGGAGAGFSGLMSTSIPGTGGVAQSMGDLGFFADAGTLNTATGTTMGGATLGGAVAGIGGGFLIGSTVGGMVAGRHQHRRTNANVGAGIGAAAGFMIGGPIGGLIGGAAGGALGGMIGPRTGPGFFHLGVGAGADGMLSITDSGQKRAGDQLAALQQQTQQQIAALNQQMAALGLRASGRAVLGSDRADPNRLGGLGDVTTQFSLTAADARIQGAIDRVGGGSFTGGLGAAQSADALIKQIDAFAQAARDAGDPIGAIRRQFDGVREAASRLGFGLDEVNAAQDRAVRLAERQRDLGLSSAADQRTMRRLRAAGATGEATDLAAFDLGARGGVDRLRFDLEQMGIGVARVAEIMLDEERTLAAERLAIQRDYAQRAAEEARRVAEQQAAERQRVADEARRAAEQQAAERQRAAGTAAGLIGGLADYALSLRTANDNGGNPLSRLAAAEAEFNRLSGLAAGGDATAIGRFQQSAEQFRALSRDVFGTGRGGVADAEARIAAALESIGNVGADALTASVLQATQREQTDTLVAALARVQDEVRGLRREVQQAQRNPLAA